MPSLTMEMTYDDLMPEDPPFQHGVMSYPILGLCHSCKLAVETATSCNRLTGLPLFPHFEDNRKIELNHVESSSQSPMLLLAVLF